MSPRWWVARQANRLPFTCWADLVTWALGWSSTPRLRDARKGPACYSDATRNGWCYCGKIRP